MQFGYNKVQDDLTTFILSLTNCTSLEYIVADDNLLKGSLPDSIANRSTHISYISIGGNQFHGRIPSGIANLLNLTVFDIVMSYLTGHIPADIGKLSKLQGLYLQGNNFIGLPSSLELNLLPCPSSKSNENKLSYKMKGILFVVIALVICATLLVVFFIFLQRGRVLKKKTPSMPSFKTNILRVSYAELLKATNGFS
ncbi:hypothetical protein ACSBR1_030628 [Camellia fascicularis]